MQCPVRITFLEHLRIHRGWPTSPLRHPQQKQTFLLSLKLIPFIEWTKLPQNRTNLKIIISCQFIPKEIKWIVLAPGKKFPIEIPFTSNIQNWLKGQDSIQLLGRGRVTTVVRPLRRINWKFYSRKRWKRKHEANRTICRNVTTILYIGTLKRKICTKRTISILLFLGAVKY